METTFAGAKLILFLGDDLLVIRRDHAEGIPYPGFLDFPGGGREGDESPEQCALRETREEVGLEVAASALSWRRSHGASWFFVAHLPAERVSAVQFGGEGYGWMLMRPEDYTGREDAIPHFREILRDYLDGQQ
ncbi:NUDIX hydrolase [Salipiger mucosus]|uniref:MutT/nudix family protein n=1 Tax=Salipiger mucosus DSM 16094 TaxID=1123237 RepID=S9SAS2_9RHOB|nr:NUDIX hydrolase [Salipiger mucosus]EPX83359.1 MutT/nudix family protein [Salipiger mucosus DSM 16094]